jgi:hypothetical protein
MILGLTCLTMIAFQNCGKAADIATAGADTPANTDPNSQKVIGQSSAYTKITYDPQLEFSTANSNGHVDLDLATGTLNLVLDTASYNCTLDAARLQQARELIAGSQICEPGPLPPGYVSCMGIAVADIELSNSSANILLRHENCNNGTFLCGDNDAALRALLNDLKANLPAGCN